MQGVTGLVFGIAGLLALIAFLPPLASRLRLPYTVLLAVLGATLGIAIGLAERARATAADRLLVDFLNQLGDMQLTSDLFLWVFLPLLLFETALQIDLREMLDDLTAILVLAVLAVVVTMLVGGLAVYSLASVRIEWCFLAAAIVATTDPAAVITIFRETGAPRRLIGLVEGESLLNDAAAIALFSALLSVALGARGVTFQDLVAGFAWEFVGGAAFGLLTGRVAAILANRLDESGPAEVTLTVALAYLTYGIADTYLHVSGVVAVVAAGLAFGTVARMRVSPHGWQNVTTIWTQVGFWASSLIFVLASMLVPDVLASAQWRDLLLIVALIAGATVARAFTLFVVLPVVTRLGRQRPVDPRYGLVILWGGLRGAVTLALALAVAENQDLPPDARHLVSVLAAGFVLFTLFVQGTTLRSVLRWVGLHRLSPVERLIRNRALALTRAEVRDQLSAAAIEHGLDLTALPLTPAPDPAELEEAADGAGDERLQRAQLVTALATLTQREAELYVDEIAARMITRPAGTALVRSTNALLDALKTEGLHGYRHAARGQQGFGPLMRLAALLHRRLSIELLLARLLAGRVEELLVRRRVLEELLTFNKRRIRALFGARIAETAEHVLDARLRDVDRALDALRLQYPQHWEAVSAQYLGRVALRLEQDAYRRMHQERLLSPQLHHHLLSTLRQQQRALERTPRLDLGLSLPGLMEKVPIVADLPAERRTELARLLRSRLALPGERIIRRGDPADAMYFIASGAVEVILGEERVRLGTGDFFGEMALFFRRPRNADVVALGYCHLLVLPREAFRRFLKAHPELLSELRRVAELRQRARIKTVARTADPTAVSRETPPARRSSLADAEAREHAVENVLDAGAAGHPPEGAPGDA